MKNKNLITVFISVLLFMTLTVSAFGSCFLIDDTVYSFKGKCLLNGDYYALYYDELLVQCCKNYAYIKEHFTEEYNAGEKNTFLDTAAAYDKGIVYSTLIFKCDETEPEMIERNNLDIISDIFNEDDVLYVGKTAPAVTVILNKENIENIRNDDRVIFAENAFFRTGAKLVQPISCGGIMGDVTGGDCKVTVVDARYVMRVSLKLESIPAEKAKRVYFFGDMDHDGHLSVKDSRDVLKTALKLKSIEEISIGYCYYFDDFEKYDY